MKIVVSYKHFTHIPLFTVDWFTFVVTIDADMVLIVPACNIRTYLINMGKMNIIVSALHTTYIPLFTID